MNISCTHDNYTLTCVFRLLLHLLPKLERVRDLRDCTGSQLITSLPKYAKKEGGEERQGSVVGMTVWMPCSGGRGRLI